MGEVSRVFVIFRKKIVLVKSHGKQHAAASHPLMRIARGRKTCLYTDSKQYAEAAYSTAISIQ